MTVPGKGWRSFILLAGVTSCSSSADSGRAGIDAQVAAELSPVVRAIEAAARTKNAAPISAVVHPDGMPCDDAVLPRVEVVAEIETPGRQLNAFFFDGPTLRRDYNDLEVNMSLHEFEQRAKKTDLQFIEVRVDKRGVLGASCVRLRAAGIEYAPHLCFYRREGRWYLASAGRFCR
jgi:hypothetical protein